jgi:Zn-dependent M28 family amino/carboxypeptidase
MLHRSVRFIGFGAEEVGLLGSYHYASVQAGDMPATRFMLNLDCVSMSRPKGLVFHKIPGADEYVGALRAQMREPLPFSERLHPHSDHFPFFLKGVITAEIGGGRFNPNVAAFGHMAGDTPDKVSLIDLREQSALAARVLFRAANDADWPFAHRTPEEVEALLKETGIDKALAFEHQAADTKSER